MIKIDSNLIGIENFDNFSIQIARTFTIFQDTFGYDVMMIFNIYIYNIFEVPNDYPMIIPKQEGYLKVMLSIQDFIKSEQIIFQFAHELCHYVFFSLKGLDKEFADDKEENICTAMSLIVINRLFPNNINYWINYVNNLSEQKYNKGALIASECNFDIMILKNKIYQMCNDNVLTHI